MTESAARQPARRLSSLPARLSSFVGRDDEIAAVLGLLRQHRLVTVVGAPGVGKTRLAIEVAARLDGDLSDRITFVSLAGLAEADLVPHAVASALGVPEQPGQSLTTTISEHLRDLAAVLVLDNCEHLSPACAALAEMLLGACPGLCILATSREPLQIEGEVTWRAPSLSTPTDGLLAPDADPLRFEAIRLFVERARAVSPAFTLTDARAPAVARICSRL
jgi:predicted ATPase